MATTKPLARAPFDPGRRYVASRSLPVCGMQLDPGDPFDTTLVTTRTLRQLYEQRAIQIAPGDRSTPSDVYVVRGVVKVNGRDFHVGDEFPRDAVPPARLQQMLRQGVLSAQPPKTRKVKRLRLRRVA